MKQTSFYTALQQQFVLLESFERGGVTESRDLIIFQVYSEKIKLLGVVLNT